MSVILFLLVLFVLILVHEWGHYITAKKTGMRVDEFGIGFPPKLFGIKKGETEYTFNALPIGGFVRIYGENLNADVKEVDPDANRAFGSRPLWAQAIVLVAGVTMNIIFAWFLFALTFMIGVPAAVDENTASEAAVLYVTSVLPEGPLAGVIPPGSQILSLSSGDNQLVSPRPSGFSNFIQDNAESELSITFLAPQSEEQTVTVRAVTGLIAGNESRSAVGVALSLVETEKYSVFTAMIEAGKTTYTGLVNITLGLSSLLADAVTGTADFTQVAGPVGIVGMVGDAADFGLTALLTFTAFISLNLAVINLLPVPALDGGRLLFVAYEAVTKKAVNPIWAGRMNLIGFVLLMLLMITVTYNDILRIFA